MNSNNLFIAVALFETPTTEFGPPDHAALIAVDTDPRKVIKIARSAENGMFFRPGGYVSVYKTHVGANYVCYKNHRTGDDLYAETSPIVFTTHRTSEGWTESWFDEEVRQCVEPVILTTQTINRMTV